MNWKLFTLAPFIVIFLSGCIVDDINEVLGEEDDLNCYGCTSTTGWCSYFEMQPANKKRDVEWERKEGQSCTEACKKNYYSGHHCNYVCTDTKCFDDSARNDTTQLYFASTKINPAELPPSVRIKSVYKGSCEKECSAESMYCMSYTMNAGMAFDFQVVAQKIFTLLQSNPEYIEKNELLATFNLKEDPCFRSNLSLEDQLFTNSGRECTLHTEVNPNSNANTVEKIRVEVPRNVVGEYSHKGSEYFSVVFYDRRQAPILVFESSLNDDYGGTIRSLSLTSTTFHVGTENGCLKFQY